MAIYSMLFHSRIVGFLHRTKTPMVSSDECPQSAGARAFFFQLMFTKPLLLHTSCVSDQHTTPSTLHKLKREGLKQI